jgi:hypothetical protein
MFTGGYFAKSYFYGSYWAPMQGAVIVRPADAAAGSGGRSAKGRKARKIRLRREDTRKLVLEALERARREGRLVDLRDYYDGVNPVGSDIWEEVKNKVASDVQESIAPAFSQAASPAFVDVAATADEIMAKAIATADVEIAKRRAEVLKKKQDDEEEIIEMLLLDGW